MSAQSYEWDISTKSFREVDDPTWDPDTNTVDESIRKAGYSPEFSSQEEESCGASINVYRTHAEKKPQYFIDVMGQNTGIATLVAKDFPSLVATLQQIQPLLSLIRLDQVVWSRCIDRES